MAALSYPLISLFNLILFFWGLALFVNIPNLVTVIICAIIFATFYDSLIISIGALIGDSTILLNLNIGRHLGHILLTPLAIIAAFKLASISNISWISHPVIIVLVWIVSIFFVLKDLAFFCKRFSPVPVWHDKTLRYVDRSVNLPIAPIVTVLFVGFWGYFIWQNSGSPCLFWSSLIMLFAGAIPQSIVGPVVCSGAEVIFMSGFYATALNVLSK